MERSTTPGPPRHCAHDHRGQKVVLPRFENVRVDGRARRYHARHFALHQFLGLARILHLVANRHAEAPPDQLGDVALGGVVGHAAHGNGRALFLVAGGQSDLEFLRGHDRVFKEEFVEVAQAEKQQRVGVALLDGAVLAHQGCGEFFHGYGGLARHYNVPEAETRKRVCTLGKS